MKPPQYTKPVYIAAILAAAFLMLEVYIAFILDYEFMRADVLDYSRTGWDIIFHEHPPLYPLSIMLARALTFDLIPVLVVMVAINLAAFIACALLMMQIMRNAGAQPEWSALAALLFGLWPLVGVTYTAVPMADIPSAALTLAGILLLQRSRHTHAGWMFGLAIITHKGVWPVIGLVILADLYTRREFISKKNVMFGIVTLLPLAVLWGSGIFYHHSWNWLMEKSMLVNTSMKSNFPVLGGVLGTFAEGGIKGMAKGSIVLFLLALSAIALFASLKFKFQYYEIAAAIALAALIMFFFSSAFTIWGPVRFSRFLTLPLMLGMNHYMEGQTLKRSGILTILIVLVLLLTQFAYAWYFVKVFYG